MSHNMIAVVNNRFVAKNYALFDGRRDPPELHDPFWRPSRGLPKNIALRDGRHYGPCVRDYSRLHCYANFAHKLQI